MRRLIFSLTCVFLTDHPTFQLQLYILLSIFNTIFIGLYSPYDTPKANRVELFNECTIFLVGCHMLAMSDFVEAETTRFLTGYSLIAIVMINIAYHILSMMHMIYCTVLKPLYYKMRNKFCLKKQNKEDSEALEEGKEIKEEKKEAKENDDGEKKGQEEDLKKVEEVKEEEE